MDSKTFQYGVKLFDSYDMSGASASSISLNIKETIGYSMHIVWSGATGSGNLLTEGSNDDTNWVTVNTTAVATASGSALLNVERAMYSFVRVSFSKGTLSAGLLTVIPAIKAR